MKRAIREKRRKRRMTGRSDGNGGTIADDNMAVHRVRGERGEDTGIGGEVGGSTAVHDPLVARLLQRHGVEVMREGGGVPCLR
jgi:hypothetical protein